MKIKERLVLLTVVLVLGITTLLVIVSQWGNPKFSQQKINRRTLVYASSREDEDGNTQRNYTKNEKLNYATECQMESCFDFTKCTRGFKVYVYPFENGARISANYEKIIRVIKRSVYYTSNPNEACLFVSNHDTTDQDRLSKDYVQSLGQKIASLPYWNGGRNHIIFSLYSGTWPDYNEVLNINLGQAILVKASVSVTYFRHNFDISFPLFDKDQAIYGGDNLPNSNVIFPVLKKYTLAFKGKRYLNGIGGESRSSLHHIHNNEDIIMLTTCRHGLNWKSVADSRCDRDNELYDRYDYDELMGNATFCLIPRGRRLGSYRFLEALKSGCIPLILSNGWLLPFFDTIDWQKAVVFADERLLTLIPTIVREFSYEQVFRMKQQVLFLWNSYFSSVDKIVHTVLKTIQSRIQKHVTNQQYVWNTFPGALHISSSYSRNVGDYPFYYAVTGHQVPKQFTAVIYATSSSISSPLYTLIQNVAKSQYVAKIVVLWTSKESIPRKQKWPAVNVTIAVHKTETKKGATRMTPIPLVKTDVILSLDEDVRLNMDEINFAFEVWRRFPERIVGFPCRGHYWDRGLSKWHYSSHWTNECSMILTSAAFYHKYYNYYYTHNIPTSIHDLISNSEACQDIVLNFVVSFITREPPIKILDRKPYKGDIANLYKKLSASEVHFNRFEARKRCFQALADEFGHMPLVYSGVRFDPVLYKDPISNFRKKYRLLETS